MSDWKDNLPPADYVSRDGAVRLYNRDCRDIVDELHFDSVVTDPPFGMEFVSNYRIESYNPIEGDGDESLLQFACGICASHSKYIFCRWDNLVNVPKPKSVITWVKNNWSMGDLEHEHARQTESILYYPGDSHKWTGPRPTDVIHAARSGNVYHPTEKPVDLMMSVVGWTDGVVLDPFAGSGSTAIACIKLGRECIAIEKNCAYFETAVRRIEEAFASQGLFRQHEYAEVCA